MDFGLEGKRALVTGGSRGIGSAIVRSLAEEGCDVALTHLDDANAANGVAATVRELGRRALALEVDASSFAGAQEVVERVAGEWGGVEILVCNAGVTSDAVTWKMEEGQWDRVLDVNLKGCFNYARAVAPHFRAQRGGRIVNVSSINGLRGKFGQVNYAASKGGMIALTKTLARELGPRGVTVNAVAPGMVATEMVRGLPEEFRSAAEEESVLGRIADPDDVAAAVVFLCSEPARHITAAVLQVDGGQYV